MEKHPDTSGLPFSATQSLPRKLWTTPRLESMGTVAQVTSKVGSSTHRDSTNQRNKTF